MALGLDAEFRQRYRYDRCLRRASPRKQIDGAIDKENIRRGKFAPTVGVASLSGVYPDYFAPVVRTGSDGVRELTMGRWGMPSPAFALAGKKTDPGVTNVRNAASPHWRRWLGPGNCCIVPFTSFSENEILPNVSRPPV